MKKLIILLTLILIYCEGNFQYQDRKPYIDSLYSKINSRVDSLQIKETGLEWAFCEGDSLRSKWYPIMEFDDSIRGEVEKLNQRISKLEKLNRKYPVIVSWDRNLEPVDYYELFWGSESYSYDHSVKIDGVIQPIISYKIEHDSTGTYYYIVRAVNSAGTSEFSKQAFLYVRNLVNETKMEW